MNSDIVKAVEVLYRLDGHDNVVIRGCPHIEHLGERPRGGGVVYRRVCPGTSSNGSLFEACPKHAEFWATYKSDWSSDWSYEKVV